MTIEVNIKSTVVDKFSISIEEDVTVLEMKEKIAEQSNIAAPQQRLIFAGQVLKDERTVDSYGIKDGLTVHLVRGKPKQGDSTPAKPIASNAEASSSSSANSSNSTANNNATQSTTNNSTPSTSAPNPLGFAGQGFGGFPGFGGGGEDMNSIQEMMNNPEMMNSMLNNPMMERLMEDPEFIRMSLNMNPQMRQIMENNPEFASVLSDPTFLRQSMEMMRNPALRQEMTRNMDRQMANIEALPGGMSALHRLHREIQEPMFEAATDATRNAVDQESNSANPTGAPNTTPVPNPWATAQPQQQNATAAPAGNPLLSALNPNMMRDPNMMQALQNLGGPERLQRQMQAMQDPETRRHLNQFFESMNYLQRVGFLPTQEEIMQAQGGAGGAAPSPFGAGMFPPTAAPAAPADPETTYASQLQQLQDMGFANREENIAALTACRGNVSDAINRLLGSF